MRRLAVGVLFLVVGFGCAKSSPSSAQTSFSLSGSIVSASQRSNVPTVTNEPIVTAPGAPSTDGAISFQVNGSAPSKIAKCRPSSAGSLTIFFDRKTTFRPASIVMTANFPAFLANRSGRITGTGSVPSTTVNGSGCVLIADTVQVGSAQPSGTNAPAGTLIPAPTATGGYGSPNPAATGSPNASTLPGD